MICRLFAFVLRNFGRDMWGVGVVWVFCYFLNFVFKFFFSNVLCFSFFIFVFYLFLFFSSSMEGGLGSTLHLGKGQQTSSMHVRQERALAFAPSALSVLGLDSD